jgi:hypothetical protein
MPMLMARWDAYLKHLGATVLPLAGVGFLVHHRHGDAELVGVVPDLTAFGDACMGLDASSWNGPAVVVGADPSVAIHRSFRPDGSWSWITCSYSFGADWAEAWAEAGKSAPGGCARYARQVMNPYDHIGLRMDIDHFAATSRRCLEVADEHEDAGRFGMADMLRRRSIEFLADAADRHVQLLEARARDEEGCHA